MIERFERFKKPLALTVIGTLGLTACAGGEATPAAAESTPIPAQTEQTTPSESGFTRTTQYFDDGSRVIYVKGQLNNDSHGSYSTNIYEFCDGKDLVETALREWRSGVSSSISRSVGYLACADGKLTESDFPTPSQ